MGNVVYGKSIRGDKDIAVEKSNYMLESPKASMTTRLHDGR